MPGLTIHRGANQIGGCCTEIAAGGSRILIDLGASLPDTEPVIEDGELVARAFEGAPPAAVLFTHSHGDHLGLHAHIPAEVPAYMGRLARELALWLAEWLDGSSRAKHNGEERAPLLKRMRVFSPGRWLRLAPELEVLPIPVDHSALDAYMFYIRAGDKKLLFTGDFREHGIQGEGGRLWAALREQVVPHGVDVLVTEGTMLGRVREAAQNPVRTEADLGRAAGELFQEHRYSFVLVSSANMDSIMQFYHNTPGKRRFVCDAYQAGMMLTAMKGMEEREPRWYRRAPGHESIFIWGGASKGLLDSLNELGASLADPVRIELANATDMRRKGFVMLLRQKMPDPHKTALNWFFPEDRSKDSQLVYSLWTGYLEGGPHPDRGMLAALGSRPLHPLHAGGHAPVATLARLMETVDPGLIIPMHTEYARKFRELPEFAPWKERVRLVQDGETFAF